MTALADFHPYVASTATSSRETSFFSALMNTIDSFGRSLEFARHCEAEYNRTGRVDPDTLKTLMQHA